MTLKVFIVGGGIVGLTAAAELRKHGHQIKIFEQSKFLAEIGAATNLGPNGMRVLRHVEANEDLLFGTHCYALRWNNEQGVHFRTWIDTGSFELETGIPTPWILSHRADIHSCLRDAATRPKAGSQPVEICLSSKVVEVDTSKGQITLANGTIETADLIIGADGINSITVSAVTGTKSELFGTNENVFRFLIPTEKVIANPKTRSLLTRFGVNTVDGFMDASHDHKLILYPCRRGSILNAVLVHPAAQTKASIKEGFLAPGSLDELLKVIDGFSPQLIEACTMAEDIKLWSLVTKDPPMTYYKDNLVLVGDAAHHLLPHQGQGAAQGMEDAVALGILLDESATPENLAARLEAYNELRYPRGTLIAILGRVDDSKREEMMPLLSKFLPHAENPKHMSKWAWTYDVISDAQERLFKLKEDGLVPYPHN